MSILSDLLFGVLSIDADAPAIEFEDAWYSWGDMKRSIDAVGAGFDALGLGEDTRVGVLLRNQPDSMAAVLATVGRDACLVSLNPLMPDDRIAEDIAFLQLPVVIGTAQDFDRPGMADALARSGTAAIELVPILGGGGLKPGFETFDAGKVRLSEPGVIIEMLTSGTTGKPKRVPLFRKAFVKSFTSAMSYEKDRSPDDPPKLRSGTQLLTNPLTHIGGLWNSLNAILGGRQLSILEKFTVGSWRDAIVRHRPKVASAVPAALRMVLDAKIPKEDLESLVALRTGAAPLDPAIVREFLDRYDIPVLQNYGATEFSGAVAGWSLGDFRKYHAEKEGSVGRFQPGVEGRVVDPDTGNLLPAGQEGVLEMKAEQFANGGDWLRTTDRAVIDEDGFLFIRGRADNAIIRGGFKVHPDDVVAVLEQHPAIREAVVVGVKDRRLGEVPAAALILRAGKTAPAREELVSFAKEKLLPYQVPTEFLFVEDVPRTPSMKPALPQVKGLFETHDAAAG